MVIGIDKDCSQGRVYWSDISSRQILSAKYDGTDKKIFIQEGIRQNKNTSKAFFDVWELILTPYQWFSDILSPEGVAVDWISRHLYWTDSTKDTIEVVSLDNSSVRAIVISTQLVNPRGIAVDPHQKYTAENMFWCPSLTYLIVFVVNCTGPTGIARVQKLNGPIWMERIERFCYRRPLSICQTHWAFRRKPVNCVSLMLVTSKLAALTPIRELWGPSLPVCRIHLVWLLPMMPFFGPIGRRKYTQLHPHDLS